MDITYLSEQRKDVLAFCGKTEDDMKEYLDILREWMKKQPHIPSELLEDRFLELHVMKNKFSIEKAKTKIENYCTLKNKPHIKYMYEKFSLIPSKETHFYIPMPNLTDDLYRVLIGNILDEEKYDMESVTSNILVLREIISRYDVSLGEIFIVDLTQCSIKFLTKLRPNLFSDGTRFMLDCHSSRLKQIHIISKFASTLVNWTKPLLPSKIASRLFAHENAEVVSKFIPAKSLPEDYGGEQKSLKEFLDDFDGIYSKNKEKILQYIETSAREELRLGGPTIEEMKGTFKKLNID